MPVPDAEPGDSDILDTRPIALSLALCAGFGSAAAAACKIEVLGELPVVTISNRIVKSGRINDRPVSVLIDTGANFSFLWEDAARALGLPVVPVKGATLYGIGGPTQVFETNLRSLQLGSYSATDLRLQVIPRSKSQQTVAPALVIGEALLARFSTEFDVAHGMIRLLRTDGCAADELPYWSERNFSLAALESWDPRQPQIRTQVVLNGKPINALFDSGAPTSAITRAGAERVGVAPWRNGTPPSGSIGGLGQVREESWIGTFATFSLGDEEVKNVSLRIADFFRDDRVVELGSHIVREVQGLPTLLIGCDFFLAHHMLVRAKERELIFTYNGGPIFQATSPPADAAAQH
jgi:predicted aspartyl protease